MRVLHIVKTSDGAAWAAAQAAFLHRAGVEVHVALPSSSGAMISKWLKAGAVIHVEDLSLPITRPWTAGQVCRRARRLVHRVAPCLIHSHFFTTTMLLRKALGHACSVPLLFQVPGPLHMESSSFRRWDLRTARPNDYWIASSRCIADHYLRANVKLESLFLSYYGFQPDLIANSRTAFLRNQLGIPHRQHVVGSVCHIYAPKYFLGQRRGLKNHETMIEALAAVTEQRRDVTAVLAGGPWPGAEGYFEQLRIRATRRGKGRILMPGALSGCDARMSWADYDCVVHIPTSENCGGVIEPLSAHVPVVAARTGGLPEVIFNGRTGVTVPHDPGPEETARAILGVLDNLPHHRRLAATGARLVSRMFDVERTAAEIYRIYQHVLDPERYSTPPPFDSSSVLGEMEPAYAG